MVNVNGFRSDSGGSFGVDPYLEPAEAVLHGIAPGLDDFCLVTPMLGEDAGEHARLKGASRLSIGGQIDDRTGTRFVSGPLAALFVPVDPETVSVLFHVFFWAHMLVVLGFLNYLPKSKHLHILSSVPNVYFSDLGPKGALKPINLADETATRYGAADIEDLTWKQLLNGYTCTECGRCTSVCPANTTGNLLNPKKVIVDVRARTLEKGPVRLAGPGGTDAREKLLAHQLLDNFITDQELWACTTCMACVQECPVMIEHVDKIVEMRRGLVLNESRFPEELRATFSNLERNFTPWGFGHSSRADWAEGLDIPRMSDVGSADVRFWVGCAGSYDSRYQKVSRAFATLLKRAGVNFAILGAEEKCNGDAARRMGNEYLAQTLMTENIATLGKYRFSTIVAPCPHCFHSLGKEYRQFGADYIVVHHSTFLGGICRDRNHDGSTGVCAPVAARPDHYPVSNLYLACNHIICSYYVGSSNAWDRFRDVTLRARGYDCHIRGQRFDILWRSLCAQFNTDSSAPKRALKIGEEAFYLPFGW